MDKQTYFEPDIELNIIEKNKKTVKLLKKDFCFMALFLVSAFIMISLGFWGEFNLGFTIAYYVFFGVSSAYLFKKFNLFSVICGGLSLAGALTLTLFDDYFVNAIMLALVAGLYVLYSLGVSNSFEHSQGSFKISFDVIQGVISRPLSAFGDIIAGLKNVNKKPLGSLIGAIISIPVLLVIVPLLVKADVAFSSLVSTVFKNIGLFILQLVLAIIIAPYLFAFAYEKRYFKAKAIVNNHSAKKLSSSIFVTFMAVVSVVYVVYLFSQLAYFFSAFKGILPADYHYTASEFARRGFFEMFAICVINLAIVSIVSMLIDKKTAGFKVLSLFISLFSVLLIVTAMQKMKLNISIYGLSRNRVIVTVFMIMMLVVIAFFVVHIFAPRVKYMQTIIVVCSALFIALSFSDVDAQIAKYNINAYQSGQIETLDIDALANLSSSSIPYIVDLMNSEDKEISKQATLISASVYYDYLGDDVKKDFRHFNLSRLNATVALDSVAPESELFDNLLALYKVDDRAYFSTDDHFEFYGEKDGKYYLNVYTFDRDRGIYVLDPERSYNGDVVSED